MRPSLGQEYGARKVTSLPDGVLAWIRSRSLPTRLAIFAVVAALSFALATAAGATMGAVVLGGDLPFSNWQEFRALGGPGEDPVSQVTDISTANTTVREDSRGDGDVASAEVPHWESLRACERTQAECANDFVAEVAPRAEYAGGRIEPDSTGRSRTVLYFVDPGRQRCDYKRFESGIDRGADSYYVVLIAGEGSFSQQQYGDGNDGCVPDI